MKVGTLLFVIVFILAASGFLLSENMNTQKELRAVTARVESMNEQLERSQSQLAACKDKEAQDAQKIHNLQAQVNELETERKELDFQLTKIRVEKTLLQAQGRILEFLESNPLLLIAALVTQMLTSVFRSGRILGLQSSRMDIPPSDEYVRLSPDERTWLIGKRMMRRSQTRNS